LVAAAAIAAAASSVVAEAMVLGESALAGSRTVSVPPSEAGRHSPSMKRVDGTDSSRSRSLIALMRLPCKAAVPRIVYDCRGVCTPTLRPLPYSSQGQAV